MHYLANSDHLCTAAKSLSIKHVNVFTQEIMLTITVKYLSIGNHSKSYSGDYIDMTLCWDFEPIIME